MSRSRISPSPPLESEIEDELKGMPYDETPGQDAAALPTKMTMFS